MIFDTRAANFPTDWFAPVPGQGWWSDTLSNYDYNANYLTGTTVGGDDHRSYFTFDVASLDRRVVSATLRIYAGDIQGDATEWLLLSDVTTPAEILNRNVGTSAVIYEDLGTGTRYGHYEIAGDKEGTWLELELSRQAVRDLNAARGGFFSLGASLTSLSGSHQSEFLFGSTDEDETAALIVETTPSP